MRSKNAGLTGPISTRSESKSELSFRLVDRCKKNSPDHDADHHDESAGRLDQHHRYAERADELTAICKRNLRSILQGGKKSR